MNNTPETVVVVITGSAIVKSAKTKYPTHCGTCPLAFAIRETRPDFKFVDIGLTGALIDNVSWDFANAASEKNPKGYVYGVTPEKPGDIFVLIRRA
jgi:hypothetical protein